MKFNYFYDKESLYRILGNANICIMPYTFKLGDSETNLYYIKTDDVISEYQFDDVDDLINIADSRGTRDHPIILPMVVRDSNASPEKVLKALSSKHLRGFYFSDILSYILHMLDVPDQEYNESTKITVISNFNYFKTPSSLSSTVFFMEFNRDIDEMNSMRKYVNKILSTDAVIESTVPKGLVVPVDEFSNLGINITDMRKVNNALKLKNIDDRFVLHTTVEFKTVTENVSFSSALKETIEKLI